MDLPLPTLKLMRFSKRRFHFIFPTLISLLPSFLALLYPVLPRRSPFFLTESCIHTTPTPSNSYCANMTSLTAILFFPLICASASLLDTCPPFPRLLLCPTTPPSFLILTLLLTILPRKSNQAGCQALSLGGLLSKSCVAPFNHPLLLFPFSHKSLECLINSGFVNIFLKPQNFTRLSTPTSTRTTSPRVSIPHQKWLRL